MPYTVDIEFQSLYPSIPKYLLSIYYMPGYVLDTVNIAVNKDT